MAKFLREEAWHNEQNNLGRTFVLDRTGADDPPILGYYSIAMSKLQREWFPPESAKAMLHRAVPAILLTNFARDGRTSKERGIGGWLMRDVLQKALLFSEGIGCYGVMLLADDSGLVAYYRDRYKFFEVNMKKDGQGMFLPIKDIRRSAGPPPEEAVPPHSGAT
jgi:hypothetical protein